MGPSTPNNFVNDSCFNNLEKVFLVIGQFYFYKENYRPNEKTKNLDF